MKSAEIDHTIRLLEQGWKNTCGILDQEEKAFVETYLGFLRAVARACLEQGWRVWFRPNRVVHWGEGGLGYLSIFIPGRRKADSCPDLPVEVKFITKLFNNKSLGEEITLRTLDRINHEVDRW